jgi:hypothetical protein
MAAGKKVECPGGTPYRVDHKVGQVGANKKTFLIIAEI